MFRNKSYLRLGRHFKNEAGYDGATDGGDNTFIATQDTGSSDAELLSVYLAQEETSHDGVDAASPDEHVGQDAVEQQPTADVFTVKINGAEKQVTRDELIANYQKGEASTQKFEEAANLRREVEQQKAATLQERAQLQNALNYFNEQAAKWAQEGQPNWQDLLENNPHEYLRQKSIYEARQVEFQKAQATQAYLNQQQEQQSTEQLNQHLQQEAQKLVELIPEWADSNKKVAEVQELTKFLMDKGFAPERIEGLNRSDAQTVKMAVNAMRYEKLVAQSKAATKQVKGLPPRMERSGVPSGNKSGFDEAKQRLARSGSIEDATAAFAAMFS